MKKNQDRKNSGENLFSFLKIKDLQRKKDRSLEKGSLKMYVRLSKKNEDQKNLGEKIFFSLGKFFPRSKSSFKKRRVAIKREIVFKKTFRRRIFLSLGKFFPKNKSPLKKEE